MSVQNQPWVYTVLRYVDIVFKLTLTVTVRRSESEVSCVHSVDHEFRLNYM